MLYISKHLLEDRPHEILDEMAAIDKEQEQIRKKTQALGNQRGNILAQYHHLDGRRSERLAARRPYEDGSESAEMIDGQLAGIDAEQKALDKVMKPKLAELDKQLASLRERTQELQQKQAALKKELEEGYVRLPGS